MHSSRQLSERRRQMRIYGTDAWRHNNVGRLLNSAIRRFESRVFKLLATAGHREARLSHLNLTRNLDVSGTRITELARRAEMTKQAMSELVVQCENLGLIKRVPDTADARAKVVKFTKRGLIWLDAFKRALLQAEIEMRSQLGTVCADHLIDALSIYASSHDPLTRESDGTSADRSTKKNG